MPKSDIFTISETRRHDGSLWKCPCGASGLWANVVSHRKGWRNRPACTGSLVYVGQATVDDITLSYPPAPVERPPVINQSYRPPVDDWFSDTEDSEALARRLLEERRGAEGGGNGNGGSNGDTNGYGPFDAGEFYLEGAPAPATQQSLSVRLPIDILVYYDAFKRMGWNRGDGTISAFVADCLLVFFQDVWGLEIFVANREDILGGTTKADEGPNDGGGAEAVKADA